MFAETLVLGRAGESVRTEYLETIMNESERLARLVDNVLDFSKIEQGKKIYRMRQLHCPMLCARRRGPWNIRCRSRALT